MNTTFITLYGYRIRMASLAPQGTCKAHVVFFNGRTEFIEKYGDFYDFLAMQGYHLWSMDWPEQGLSERSEGKSRNAYLQTFADYPVIAKAFIEYLQMHHQLHQY